MNTTLKDELIQLGACPEAIEWVGERTFEQAWADCERADWMFWYLVKRIGTPGFPTHQEIVRVNCLCVRRALRFVPEGELRPLKAIEAAERWADNPTLENRKTVEAAAAAARAAAEARSVAAVEAAWAAAWVTETAASAWVTAWAAASAAEAATSALAVAAANEKANELRAMAEIIRERIKING